MGSLIERSSQPQYASVNVHAAKNLIASGYRYLDVRTEEEFKRGHLNVENCFNIPYMIGTTLGLSKNPNFLEQVSSVCSMDDHLIVGCQGGLRSAKAASELFESGFKYVTNMEGGYSAWENNGLSVKK